MIKIDTEKQSEVASRYGISSLPTLAVIRADGKPLMGTVGFLDAEELVQSMRDAMSKTVTKKEKSKALELSPHFD